MLQFDTISEAYLAVLADVLDNPEFKCKPRDQEIAEQTDREFQINRPTSDPIETKDKRRNETLADYLEKEKELYDSGCNEASEFAKISKFWDKIKNPDGTVNSAYGKLIYYEKTCGNPKFGGPSLTPFQWCRESLIRDKDSRQAYIRVARPDHLWQGNKDQVCTLHINFLIREDALNMCVVMRSNDLVKGFAYDAPWFVTVMEKLLKELREVYPKLRMGHYRHFAHSLHIYERDIPKVLKMLGR